MTDKLHLRQSIVIFYIVYKLKICPGIRSKKNIEITILIKNYFSPNINNRINAERRNI